MRDLMFKGRTIINQEWIEGSLIHDEQGNYYIGEFLPKQTTEIVCCGRAQGKTLNRFKAIGFTMVDPKTICQYADVRDANGKRIYENDILFDKHGGYMIVKWHNMKFMLKGANGKQRTWAYVKEYRIKGNLFDNPELLKR